MFASSVIKMEHDEYHELKNALQLLETQHKFLSKKADEDSDLEDLMNACCSAVANLSDYFDEYERQFSKED